MNQGRAEATTDTQHTGASASEDRPTAPWRQRWEELDMLRGLALSGIIFVNAAAIAQLSMGHDGIIEPGQRMLGILAHQRFFPIFAFLFGVSFGIMWLRWADTQQRPRLMLLLRSLALGVLGAAHQVFQPGEALLPFAIVLLVILLPATWLPTWAMLVIGAGLLVPGVLAGGTLLLPGLTLIGFWLARSGNLFALLRLPTRALAPVTAGAIALAVPALLWQERDPLNAGFSIAGTVAGLLGAAAYCLIFLLLFRIPGVRRVLTETLGSLGKLSLSNYLAVTVVLCSALALAKATGTMPAGGPGWTLTMWGCVAILAVQVLLSRAIVRARRQGPAELALRRFSRLGSRRRTS